MRKPCCNDNKNKGAWSKQEDQKLIDYIRAHGEGCWRSLPQAAGLLRCGKSCRLRWINYLRPDVKRGNFGEDEEDLIIKLHALLGNRWSLIAGRLPGRTDNEVKNYWNSHLRRKLMRMGIDPNNHRLAHSLPRDHQDQRLSSESSDNNNITYHKLQVKPSTQGGSNINKNDHPQVVVSDDQAACGSSLEEDHQACALRLDLNLELTMTIKPSASSVLTHHHIEEKKHNVQEYSNITRELESCSPPTLLLFT